MVSEAFPVVYPYDFLRIPALFIAGLSLVALISLGIAVLLRNHKSHTNILFFLLAISFAIYAVVNYLSIFPLTRTVESQLFWIRMVMLVAAFKGPLLLLLALTFPKEKITLRKEYVMILVFLALFTAFLTQTPYIFESINYTNGAPIPAPGSLMPIFFFDFVGLFVLSFAVLVYRKTKTSGREKVQILYILIGMMATFVLTVILTLIPVTILKTSSLVFLGPLAAVTLVAFIAYAIIKHHFLDITPAIARATSFTLFFFIIASIYINILFFVGVMWLKLPFDGRIMLISAALILLITFTFQPLYSTIRKFTSKFFFKKLYDEEKLIDQLTHIMAGTIDLSHMAERLLKELLTEMQISKAAFLIIDNHKINSAFSNGYNPTLFSKSPLEVFLHKELGSGVRAFVFQFIEDGATKDLFRQFDIEVLFPIKAGGQEEEEVALLVLGKKSSGDMYAARDLRFLDLFSTQAGIAIQKAKALFNLKISSEAKSRFISVVSHQLRTPISGIRWSLEMVRQEHLEPQEQARFLDNTYQSVIFLSEQLDDILLALDIYDKKIFLKKDLCKLNEIFKDITEEFMGLIKSKKLVFIYDIDTGANQVLADHGKLKKIVKTLIKNALVYSPAGGKIKIASRVEISGNSKRVVVSINDEGIGITESEREHIFDEFFRSEKARTAFPNGLGLGMFIAQAFIKAHNGEIWFYSEGRNKGVDFHFALPME